jgi:capsular polysaccharide transport system permease protein
MNAQPLLSISRRASSLSKVIRGSGGAQRLAVARDWLKRVVQLLPTILALLYFGLWATPRYVSETTFVVRGSNAARLSGLEALFRTFGISRAVDDANIVQQYMLSRDAVAALSKRAPLREIFSRPQGDVFARFPRFWENDGFEGLYAHYLTRVAVVQDANRGVINLRVETFYPKDSYELAQSLMSLAEEMVNTVNSRALNDTLAHAQQEVSEAERKLIDAQMALTQFRNEAALIDPGKNSASTLDTIGKLSTELTLTLAQIQQLRRTAPTSPTLPSAQARAEALRARIAAERATMAGDDTSLATKMSNYERLTLERDLADKSVASALTSLESARQEARRQQIYVERVSGPDLPDHAAEPRRLRMIFTVLLVSLMSYAVIWILTIGAKEHAQGTGR